MHKESQVLLNEYTSHIVSMVPLYLGSEHTGLCDVCSVTLSATMEAA